MSDLKFTEDHAWIREERDGVVTVGISDHAQNELGDIVYIGLPEVGRVLGQGDVMAVVESVKTAGDIVMPVSGEILSVNDQLEDAPELINADPETAGWLATIEIIEPSELDALMDNADYRQFIEGL